MKLASLVDSPTSPEEKSIGETARYELGPQLVDRGFQTAELKPASLENTDQ